MKIIHVSTFEEVEALKAEGFCPVECSFGNESSVDSLMMDHHGKLSHLTGVALRANEEHFGARKDDPRFVVTGDADKDATFAIYRLCGMGPSGLSDLAALINRVDTDPIGVRLEETEEGRMLLLWSRLASHAKDATAFYAGVDRWRWLLEGRKPEALLSAIAEEEKLRVQEARKACFEKVSEQVAFVTESGVWGFDVWYAELAPVIVSFEPTQGRATIGCPNVETAERFFGSGGLMNIFRTLKPDGWGGRESIGGSPRGLRISRDDAFKAAEEIASILG